MAPWLKIAILIAGLVLVLLVASLTSRAPTLSPRSQTREPEIPPLARITEADPELEAEAVLVQRLRNAEALYSRNAEQRLPIASLTKLMTALILVERADPLGAVEFTPEAKRVGDPDYKRSAVPAGERLKVEDVLKLLLVSSDNDAAYAAAEHVVGLQNADDTALAFPERISRFVGLMNERARALGLGDTRFANPAGSDDPENYSSSRDMVRLAAYVSEHHPELWAITRVRETFVFGTSGSRYGLVNTNQLLSEYPALFGSKTGYDDEARGALMLLYRLAPEEVIAAVLLRSPDRFADGRALIGWLESSFALESR